MRKTSSTGTKAAAASAVKTNKKVNEKRDMTPADVVCFAKSISKSTTKCIDYVTLTQSQYPSCSNINITLTEELSAKLTSPLIMIEGDGKIYKNKSNDNFRQQNCGFFLRIRPKSASPLLYQLLEHIYTNIDQNVRIPPSLSTLQVTNIVEKTIKEDFIYVNKLSGAIVEYTSSSSCERSRQKCILDELESLALRDPQIIKVLLVPLVVYRTGNETKITFALKKIMVEKDCSITVLDINGESAKIKMSAEDEEDEEDCVRKLCVVEDVNVEEDDDDSFNV
ncbi:ssdna-binding phosphoprotein [Pteropox virus]|uniref:Protein OPG079 n=1 Tax=Pteropox virus TaxID=1873698 RepID=A0A1B1MRC4_9POXV|nr:ssdna-binding phosphoprotein [Pteropox virus]ANS71134.1 ssdna-binding phosphoprotein [Pteropox virus]